MLRVTFLFLLVQGISALCTTGTTRSCVTFNASSFLTPYNITYVTECNPPSEEQPVSAVRCGNVPIGACFAPSADIRSMCLFTQSCYHNRRRTSAGPWTPSQWYTASNAGPPYPINTVFGGEIGTSNTQFFVTCQNFDIALTYHFQMTNNNPGECYFSVNTTAQNMEILTMIIPRIDASVIWAMGNTSSSSLMSNITVNTGSLCTQLKITAIQSGNFSCAGPFVESPPAMCTLSPVVRTYCNDFKLEFQIQGGGYTAIVEAPASVLEMICYDVDVLTVQDILIEESLRRSLNLTDLSQLPYYSRNQSQSGCTRMATRCEAGLPSGSFFTCKAPFYSPTAGVYASTFCARPSSYSQVVGYCNGQAITYFNPLGESNNSLPHTAIHSDGFLSLNCYVNNSLMVDLYSSNRDIITLYALCESDTNCNASAFTNIILISRGGLVSQQVSRDPRVSPTAPAPKRPLGLSDQHSGPSGLMALSLNLPTLMYAQRNSDTPVTRPDHIVDPRFGGFVTHPEHIQASLAHMGLENNVIELSVDFVSTGDAGFVLRTQPIGMLHGWRRRKVVGHRIRLMSQESVFATSARRPTLATQRHLLQTSVQDQLIAAAALLGERERALCNTLLDTCGSNLTCIGDRDVANPNNKLSREEFCTVPLKDSCQGFPGDPPLYVGWNTTLHCPLTVTAPTLGVGSPLSQYYHQIECVYVPLNGNCYYSCTVTSGALVLSAYPVLASVLLSPTLNTDTKAQEREKCRHVMNTAQNLVYETNTFTCYPPYRTTYEPVNITTSRVQDVCVNSEVATSFNIICGELNIRCDLQANSFLFTCLTPDSWNVTGLNYTAPYLYANNVPLDTIVQLNTNLTRQACVLFRDTYLIISNRTSDDPFAIVPTVSNYSCVIRGTCISGSNCTRIDNDRTVCTPEYDPALLSSTTSLVCGDLVNAPIRIGCSRNEIDNTTYLCTASDSSLVAYCPSVDGYNLMVQLAPSSDVVNGGVDTDPVSIQRHLQRCLFIKSSCTTFQCNCNFRSNATTFCDHPGVPIVYTEDSFTCGARPEHLITCSNYPNQTLTEFGSWFRCTTSSDNAILKMNNCLVPRDQYFATASSPRDRCDLLRRTCSRPTPTCEASQVCACPTEIESRQFECIAPAQICKDQFCQTQFDDTYANGTQDVESVCRFYAPQVNISCGGPSMVYSSLYQRYVSSPLYNITCDISNFSYHCSAYNGPAGRRIAVDCDVDLNTFQLDSTTAQCLFMGQQCVNAGGIICSGGFTATRDQPFCSYETNITGILDAVANSTFYFTCDGLLLKVQRDPFANLRSTNLTNMWVSSNNASSVWKLKENRDSTRYPSPFPFEGCVLGPPVSPDFFKNEADRCNVVLTNCKHSCINGDIDGIYTPEEAICSNSLAGLTRFFCDGQEIECLPIVNASISENITGTGVQEWSLNADKSYNQRVLMCRHIVTANDIYNNSLYLQCKVNRFMFTNAPDFCSVLLSECTRLGGAISCTPPYIRTVEHQFCTNKTEDRQPESGCTCVWWSQDEGRTIIPVDLVDKSCIAYDLDNRRRGVPPGVALTDRDGGAPSPAHRGPEPSDLTRLDSDMQVCIDQANQAPEGLSCRERGYLRYDEYLRRRHGPNYRFIRDRVYGTRNFRKEFWCVESYVRPVRVCATRVGMGLPLCRVECPVGLIKTSVGGSITKYCCFNVNNCSTALHASNCVLGRHDPTGAENPWLLPGDATNAYITTNFTYPDPYILPNQQCPKNMFEKYTAIARPIRGVQGTEKQRYQQYKTMCTNDALCNQYVIVTDLVNLVEGVFFASRPIQYLYNSGQSAITNALINSDPYMKHIYNTGYSYHLHPVADSDVPRLAMKALYLSPNTQAAMTFFVERAHGYKCKEYRPYVTEYVAGSIEAMNRVMAWWFGFLQRKGADQGTIAALNWKDSSRREFIRTNMSHISHLDVFDNMTNTTVRTYPNMKYVIVNMTEEALLDIQNGVSITGAPVNISNGTLANILALHPQLEAVTRRLYLFGRKDYTVSAVSEVYGEFLTPTVSQLTPMENNPQDIHYSGFLTIPEGIEIVQFGSYMDILKWRFMIDWMTFGYKVEGYSRPGPNNDCILNTPQYFSTVDSNGNACNREKCPIPVSKYYGWSPIYNNSIYIKRGFPDPPEVAIEKMDAIPCLHGWCMSTPATQQGQGLCVCDPFFQLKVPMVSNGLPGETPARSRYALSCELDYRGRCTDEFQTNVLCAGNGECVSGFDGAEQTAECDCMRFPKSPTQSPFSKLTCNEALPVRDCEILGLKPEPTGYLNGDKGADSQCTAPQYGCRSDGPWIRAPDDSYNLTDSYGCEKPPTTKTKRKYGFCTIKPAYVNDTNNPAAWGCNSCAEGHYGRLCEYIGMDFGDNTGCFNAASAPRFQTTNSSQNVYFCYWDRQLQRPSYINPAAPEPASTIRHQCAGVLCSGHGTCSHPNMDQPLLERVEKQPGFATWLPNGPEFTAFGLITEANFRAQTCTCAPGWGPPACSQKVCLQDCGLGYCDKTKDPPVCKCPTDLQRRVLVQGEFCEGVRCSGNGNLTNTSGIWRCECTLPYYQKNATSVCMDYCNCTSVCANRGGLVSGPTPSPSSSNLYCYCAATGTLPIACAGSSNIIGAPITPNATSSVISNTSSPSLSNISVSNISDSSSLSSTNTSDSSSVSNNSSASNSSSSTSSPSSSSTSSSILNISEIPRQDYEVGIRSATWSIHIINDFFPLYVIMPLFLLLV